MIAKEYKVLLLEASTGIVYPAGADWWTESGYWHTMHMTDAAVRERAGGGAVEG
jgi:hypothetical protein